jgi:hypothetical protein
MKTYYQTAIVARLLHADVPGVRALRQQLGMATAFVLIPAPDNYGSFFIYLPDEAPDSEAGTLQIEGTARDEDNGSIVYRLRVVDGRLHELEVSRADGWPVRRLPEPEEIELIVSSQPPTS